MRGKARWCRWRSSCSSCSRASHPTPALVLEASLPLPHSPAALCLRPIIPLLDDPGGALCSVIQGALVASKVERSSSCSRSRSRHLHNWKRGPEKSIHNALGRDETHPTPDERTDRHRRAEPLSRPALPPGESSHFASEVEINPIPTCP